MAITIATVLGLGALAALLVRLVVVRATSYRIGTFGGSGERGASGPVKVLGVLIWAGLKPTCLFGGLLFAPLAVVAIYHRQHRPVRSLATNRQPTVGR